MLAQLGCPSLATGGIEDHVHILHSLGRTQSVAWVMEKLKSNSSRWMKEQGAVDFWWQPGYAAFSVGQFELERVKRYIYGQRLNLGRIRSDIDALWNFAPHDISIIQYWLGDPEPLSVFRLGMDYIQTRVDDVVFLNLKYPGKIIAIHLAEIGGERLQQPGTLA